MSANLFIGRQPIVDAARDVVGYELLYRSGSDNVAEFTDEDLASSQVIVSAFMELGLELIVGSQRAFVNMTRPFLVGEIPIPMGPEQVALEVREDLSADQAVIAGLTQLQRDGYTLVLDDLRDPSAAAALLALVDYVKLDMLDLDAALVEDRVAWLKRAGSRIIAQRVETQQSFERCQALGVELFQGYFLGRPTVVEGRALPGNKAAISALIARLDGPAIAPGELERLIVQDVTFSYRLLRFANCATFAQRREVGTIGEAIELLGLPTVRNWAALIALSRLGTPKPTQLLKKALIRARMGEALAQHFDGADAGQAFTVGLFSTLDVALDSPMADLLDTLPLVMPIKLALLEGEGPLGDVLAGVLAYESGDWTELERHRADLALHRAAWQEAVGWAETNGELLRAIASQSEGG